MKEKTSTRNKSRKASAKRETEFYEMVEAAVTDGKQERERGMIRDLLGEIRKRREEEDEARNLNEEMQRNLEEAQHKSLEVERKLDRVLWEYIEAFHKGTRTSTAHYDKALADDAEQRYEELELGRRSR